MEERSIASKAILPSSILLFAAPAQVLLHSSPALPHLAVLPMKRPAGAEKSKKKSPTKPQKTPPMKKAPAMKRAPRKKAPMKKAPTKKAPMQKAVKQRPAAAPVWLGQGGWTPTGDGAVSYSTPELAYAAMQRAGLPVGASGLVIGDSVLTPAVRVRMANLALPMLREWVRTANIALLRSEGLEISEEAERDMEISIQPVMPRDFAHPRSVV